MYFEVRVTPEKSAEQNMALDAAFLNSLRTHPRVILHFYQWSGINATHGYFTDPFAWLNREEAAKRQLQLAKRPTGGGIIFHHCDLAFSLLIPSAHPGYSINPLNNYSFVNHAIISAIKSFNGKSATLLEENGKSARSNLSSFCLATPTKFDVMLEGKKIAGGAQRRIREGFLHQGSISLTLPSKEFLENLVSTEVSNSIFANSASLLGLKFDKSEFKNISDEMREWLIKSIKQII